MIHTFFLCSIFLHYQRKLLLVIIPQKSRMLTCVQEFTVVIDRRTGNWTVVKSIVARLNVSNCPSFPH